MPTQKIFGGNLTTGQQSITVLGSTASGSPQYIQMQDLEEDIANLQNTQYSNAINNDVWVRNPDPANVSSYNGETPYLVGQYAKDTLTNIVYQSLQGTVSNPNLGNPLSNEIYWKIVGNKFLPLQEVINGLAYLFSVNIAEIQENGILPYNLTTPYKQGAIVINNGTSQIYQSKQNNNLGNILTNTSYWKYLGDLRSLNSASTINQGTVLMSPNSTSNIVPDINVVNSLLALTPSLLGTVVEEYIEIEQPVLPIIYETNGIKKFLLNGQTINQTDAPALFAKKGWTGSKTLQNRTGRVSLQVGGSYTIGTTGGNATHTLTINEMPSHDHKMAWASSSGDATGYIGGRFNSYVASTSSIGGNQPHNNMQPYIVSAFYIIGW